MSHPDSSANIYKYIASQNARVPLQMVSEKVRNQYFNYGATTDLPQYFYIRVNDVSVKFTIVQPVPSCGLVLANR